MNWEIVIGIETHAQLSTRSKIFSRASTAFGAAPNTQACAIDMALPGTLPVLNEGAVERAIRFGLAIGGTINRRSIFARKNYFYPDLPKGYQISQYEIPIVQGGSIPIETKKRGPKVIRLTRAHLEEDAGKSIHGEALSGVIGRGVVGRTVAGDSRDLSSVSAIDLNRAGTPLLEIVSEPEMSSADEAVAYAKTLHELVQWIQICDGNMQEGSFRCDANVSVRRPGASLGTRREIKNLNSFRFLQQAIEYEVKWQIEMLEDGGRIEQATVLFDPDTGETRMMRTKEDAHDYRYFPDPDLLPLEVNQEWIDKVALAMPESQREMQERFIKKYQISEYEAKLLTANRATATYFEDATSRLLQLNPAKWSNSGTGPSDADRMYGRAIAKGVIGLLSAQLNRENVEIAQSKVTANQFAVLHARLIDGTVGAKAAREVFQALWEFSARGEDSVDAVIEAKGLTQLSDAGVIARIVDEVIAANAQQVADYRGGKEKAFNSLVGQVMKASKGKADPAQVNEILKKKLG
jgi:aspartyl-tRNA(Asn)/glutamyl-tRNA(Gln) amidotransferase subunit B